MSKSKRKISAIVLGLGIIASQSALAAYSDYGTFDVTSGSLQAKTTSGKMLEKTKATDGTEAHFQASTKTMWTDPTARIVNSDLEKKSSWVEIKTTGETYTAIQNTLKINHYAYVQIKPDAAQSGTDSIKLRFDPE